MRTSLLLCVVGLILILGGFFIYKEHAPVHIIAFGDSLTYGTGSTQGGGFVKILEEELGVPIENLGVSGDTSADGVARIDEVIERKPTITIVFFGGNDIRNGVSPLETAKNLALIDAALTHAGSKVLVLNLEVLDGVWGHPDLMADSLHPNDKGYALMAARIKPSLAALLPRLSWLPRVR